MDVPSLDCQPDGQRSASWLSANSKDARRFEADIAAAHDAADVERLATLYRQAAEIKMTCGDVDAGCFLLTQAYVYALESGLSFADDIHAELKSLGRET